MTDQHALEQQGNDRRTRWLLTDYGPFGDGVHLDTRAVQDALDDCERAGGGEVVVQAGTYKIGTVHLRSNVFLRLEPGATLLGSDRLDDYATDTFKNLYRDEPFLDRCLIYGDDIHNAGIVGDGTIQGNGVAIPFIGDLHPEPHRPMTIRLKSSSGIRLRDFTIRNTPSWGVVVLYSTDVVVRGLSVFSGAHGTSDGIDFDGCSTVRVDGCYIRANDDCICVQTSNENFPSQDISIQNCSLSSRWDAIRIGLLSRARISNVVVSGCTFFEVGHIGISLENLEGGSMETLVFTGIAMREVGVPIFIAFGQRVLSVDGPDEPSAMQRMGSFMFSNINVSNSSVCELAADLHDGTSEFNSLLYISGMPGSRVGSIMLSDCMFETLGGVGTETTATDVLGNETGRVTGMCNFDRAGQILPASAIFARHVEQLTIRNVSSPIDFRTADRPSTASTLRTSISTWFGRAVCWMQKMRSIEAPDRHEEVVSTMGRSTSTDPETGNGPR